MFKQNSFLTATVEPATTAVEVNSQEDVEVQTAEENVETQTTEGDAEAQTAEENVEVQTTEGDVEAQTTEGDISSSISIDTEVLGNIYNSLSDEAKTQIGDNGENITVAEDGSLVVVNQETGESVLLSDLGVDMDELVSAISVDTSTLPAPIVQKDMTGFTTTMYVAYGVVCVVLIALILSQKKRSAAFGNGMSSGQPQSYWDKNKGRSQEGKMDFYTKCGIGLFMVLTFIIALM